MNGFWWIRPQNVLTAIAIILAVAIASKVFAGSPCTYNGYYVFAQDSSAGKLGTYLGLISDNSYSSESIINEYGSYGSAYSSTSIYNQYGQFGGAYAGYSAFNAYSLTPPVGYSKNGNVYTAEIYISKNKFLSGYAVLDPDTLKLALTNGCPSGIPTQNVLSKPSKVLIKNPGQEYYDVFGKKIDGSKINGIKLKMREKAIRLK